MQLNQSTLYLKHSVGFSECATCYMFLYIIVEKRLLGSNQLFTSPKYMATQILSYLMHQLKIGNISPWKQFNLLANSPCLTKNLFVFPEFFLLLGRKWNESLKTIAIYHMENVFLSLLYFSYAPGSCQLISSTLIF